MNEAFFHLRAMHPKEGSRVASRNVFACNRNLVWHLKTLPFRLVAGTLNFEGAFLEIGKLLDSHGPYKKEGHNSRADRS